MRAEDKLEAEEAEEAQEVIQGLEEGRDDEQAEAEAEEALPAAARELRDVLMTMRAILEDRHVDREVLAAMPRAEREALEVFEQVVTARNRRNTFIYAEDRIEQLNEVLAVLQPVLSVANVATMEDLSADFDAVVDEIAALRDRLAGREDAEEELLPVQLEREATGDKDDDDDDDDDGLGEVPEPGAPARPSSLSAGAAVPDKASPKTTLIGAAVPDKASPPTTLTGSPAAPDKASPPTTLSGGPEAPAFDPGPSTLSEEPAASTGGDGKRGRKAR